MKKTLSLIAVATALILSSQANAKDFILAQTCFLPTQIINTKPGLLEPVQIITMALKLMTTV